MLGRVIGAARLEVQCSVELVTALLAPTHDSHLQIISTPRIITLLAVLDAYRWLAARPVAG
jgi:hypothetical protein